MKPLNNGTGILSFTERLSFVGKSTFARCSVFFLVFLVIYMKYDMCNVIAIGSTGS